MNETQRIIENTDLTDQKGVFRDRAHAGQVLATMLEQERNSGSLLMAIPAGGIPVATELARALGLELDLAVVSKITLPWNTEAGYGAVAFDGSVLLNEPLIEKIQLPRQVVDEGIAKTRQKVERRLQELRGAQKPPDLKARKILLVDDGLASGFTLLAAAEACRQSGARSLIAVVPTAHESSAVHVARELDGLYCANLRGGRSFAVAHAYQRWSDVSEQEAARLLADLQR